MCDTVEVRTFSTSTIFKTEKVIKQDSDFRIESISGYVTCVYNAEWWLSLVLDVDVENAVVRIMFLHPRGPARSFNYPSIPDILTIPSSDILTTVEPNTATGRAYTLSKTESKMATKKLAAWFE